MANWILYKAENLIKKELKVAKASYYQNRSWESN